VSYIVNSVNCQFSLSGLTNCNILLLCLLVRESLVYSVFRLISGSQELESRLVFIEPDAIIAYAFLRGSHCIQTGSSCTSMLYRWCIASPWKRWQRGGYPTARLSRGSPKGRGHSSRSPSIRLYGLCCLFQINMKVKKSFDKDSV